jgi:hypothetical protein
MSTRLSGPTGRAVLLVCLACFAAVPVMGQVPDSAPLPAPADVPAPPPLPSSDLPPIPSSSVVPALPTTPAVQPPPPRRKGLFRQQRERGRLRDRIRMLFGGRR